VSAPACSNRSTKAILALDRQHGIYREQQEKSLRISGTIQIHRKPILERLRLRSQ
jgi:hypothetical protein